MTPYYCWPSLQDIVTQVKTGTKTAREQVELALNLSANEGLNSAVSPSFISLHAQFALAQADAIDLKIKRGEEVGDLAGVPFAVKDNIDWQGFVTTAGSPKVYSKMASHHATVLQGLIARGAIPIGKTNMNEWAVGLTGENAHFGDVLNPYISGSLSGGSSSGSARAVAMGMVPIALGSDTGGSIRMPAAWCGIVGLRPSIDSFSLDGVVPRSRSLDVVGPIAQTLEDCEYFLGEFFLPKSKMVNPIELPEELRIGWDPKLLEVLNTDVRATFMRFMERALETKKVHFIEQDWPSFTIATAHAMTVLQKEFFDDFQKLCGDPESFAECLGKPVLNELRQSASLEQAQLTDALAELKEFGHFFDEQLQSVELLALALTPCGPVVQKDLPSAAKPLRELSLAMGASGLPILSLPLINGDQSAPSLAGIQFVGQRFQEHKLIYMVKRLLAAPN